MDADEPSQEARPLQIDAAPKFQTETLNDLPATEQTACRHWVAATTRACDAGDFSIREATTPSKLLAIVMLPLGKRGSGVERQSIAMKAALKLYL